MSTNKKYPTVKVGLTIHSKRMKELTKGKRWVGYFENEFATLMVLQNDEDNSLGQSFAYGGGFHSEGYYRGKKITNQKEATSVLCQMGVNALKTIDWTAIKEIYRLSEMGGDKTQHRKDSAFATECCHKYVRRSIKVNKGSLSKEDVIMALLFDLLNDAVGEFCDAEFDNEILPFIEKFIGMVTFIEVLRTHYLMDLNKILKGIDSAIVFCTPIRKEMIH